MSDTGNETTQHEVLTPFVRALLDASHDAAILTDAQGLILEWNQSAVDLFGWTRAEAVGREMEHLIIPPLFRSDYRRGIERFRQTGTGPVLSGTHELTALRRSGEQFPMQLSTSAVPHGEQTIFVGFVRDTTARIATEQRLARQTLETELLQQATLLSTEGDSFDEALQTCLDTLCEVTESPVGHVYIVDDSGQRLISSGVWHLDDPAEFSEFRRMTETTAVARGEGFVGRIWETGEPAWVRDIAEEIDYARDMISSDLKVHGAFAFPIKIDSEIAAVMEFFTPDEITPDPQLLRLVNNIGGQLGRLMERRRLQQEQTRQAAIVDSSSDAIISRDISGAIISWNDGAERIYGYTAEEAMTAGIDLVLPEEMREEENRIFDAVRRGQCVQQFETRRRRRDGVEVTVSVTVSPIYDADDNLIGASTIERDITQLIHTQRELERSEQHARLLLESTAEAIYGIDLHGRCTFCNPACVTMLGYDSADELLGRNMHAMVHHSRPDGTPYDHDECRIYQAIRRMEGTHVDDELLWRKDGSGFATEYWSHPIVQSGDIVGAVVTFLDITERKHAEEAQARIASIVDSSVDAIITSDPDGTIVSWNRGAELVYGYRQDQILGRNVAALLPPGLKPSDSLVLKAIRKGEELTQLETVRWRQDHKIIDVSITVTPIRVGSHVVGASTIERDITARRQREKELELARDAAESANRAKSQFLANISHELRTPMNSIMGMTDLALREELSSDVRDCLVTARDSADTLLFLLNDILDFSRMEAGRFELEPVDFNLRSMLNDTIKSMSLRAQEKGLELACQIDANLPYWLCGDALRLRQVITNLVTNALKFTEQGEVIVRVRRSRPVSVTPKPGDDLELHISVTDTGIGISAADQERIFAPFTQADASTTRRYSGTGLGLSICGKLTTLMDGRMWVESEAGAGSTFHFTARLQVAEAGNDQAHRQTVTVEQLRSIPVLLVDDNDTNLRILSQMLKNWSLNPVCCSDAGEAYKKLVEASERGEPFRLIIVDALMPDVDGFMLIERINADDRLSRSTILMLSSADRQMFKDRCSTLPVSAYLEKPVSQSDLLVAIMATVEGPRVQRFADVAPGLIDRPLTILVAEDTPANQKVITRILHKRGHNVEIANNGREAIDRNARGRFDVIIMDVQMPTLDGLQATAAIRKQEQVTGQHVPIIAMTAHAMRGDREKCLAAGMDDYLSKPVDSDKLIRMLESLAGSESDAVLTAQSSATPAGGPDVGRAVDTLQPADALAIWSPAAALSRLGNDRELLNDMIGFFLEDSPQLLASLEAAISGNNTGEMTRAAHSLKGLCANFEASSATAAARAVQKTGEAGELATPADVTQLKVEIKRLSEHLTLWQAENENT